MNAGVEIEKIAQAIGISKEEIERIVEEHRQ